jgi:hypothetical protein
MYAYLWQGRAKAREVIDATRDLAAHGLRNLRFMWMVVREFVRGFRALHYAGPCVSVFGSARVAESPPFYALVRELGAGLSRQGLMVLTGSGLGIMEVANRRVGGLEDK